MLGTFDSIWSHYSRILQPRNGEESKSISWEKFNEVLPYLVNVNENVLLSIKLTLRTQLESKVKYCIRQRGCSLINSARTPPAVHRGITIWVDEIEFEKK